MPIWGQTAIALSIAALVLIGHLLPAFAQDNTLVPSVTVAPGELLELAIGTRANLPEYSWILSKDRNFVNAGRTRIFQTRQTEPGVYNIDVNVLDARRTMAEYYSFLLNVSLGASVPSIAESQPGPLQAVLSTQPPSTNGTVHLMKEGGILTLYPASSAGDIVSYDIDFDAGFDASGDGIPDNDRDTQGSYSQQAGTPIRLYLKSMNQSTAIALTVTDRSGATSKATVSVLFDGLQSFVSSSYSPTITSQEGDMRVTVDGLTISPSLSESVSLTSAGQKYYEWDFGDGRKSLLKHPSHAYAQPGEYVVSLAVKDIASGEVAFSGSMNVSVQLSASSSSLSQSISSSQSTSSLASSQEQGEGESESPRSLWSIVKVALILLVLIQIGLALFHLFLWIKRRSAGALHSTIEKMEHSLFDSETQPADVIPAVMPLKRPESGIAEPQASQEAQVDEPLSTSNVSLSPPAQSEGPVPDWLKNAPSSLPTSLEANEEASPQPPAEPVVLSPDVAPVAAVTPPWLTQQPVPTDAASSSPPAEDHMATDSSHQDTADIEDDEDDDTADDDNDDDFLNDDDIIPPDSADALPQWLQGGSSTVTEQQPLQEQVVASPEYSPIAPVEPDISPSAETVAAIPEPSGNEESVVTPLPMPPEGNEASPQSTVQEPPSIKESGEILPLENATPPRQAISDDNLPIAIVRAESIGSEWPDTIINTRSDSSAR